ncbi:MAG: hypothetical protein AABX33_03525 [Nanoarchaeota archaeon]
MDEQKGDSQLNWFWKLTTKWWFFPVFYVFLTMLLSLVDVIFHNKPNWLTYIVFMPSGVMFIVQLIIKNKMFNDQFFINTSLVWFAIFFHLINIFLIILITNTYNKRKIVVKWVIIILMLLMIIQFLGCGLYLSQHPLSDFSIH